MESTTHLSIYRQVAKTALMNWNGINDEEAEKIVMIQSFDELENQVWASGSLSYAVEALAQIFQLQEKLLIILFFKSCFRPQFAI